MGEHTEIEILIAKKIAAEQNRYQMEILGFWVQAWLQPDELDSDCQAAAAVRIAEIGDSNIRLLLASIAELMPLRQRPQVQSLSLGQLLKLVVLNAYLQRHPAAKFDAMALEMLTLLAIDACDTMPLLPVAVAESIRNLRAIIAWKAETLDLGRRWIAALNSPPTA